MRDRGSAPDEPGPSHRRRPDPTDSSATDAAPSPGFDPEDPLARARAVRAELDRRPGRAPKPWICPFLRVAGAGGKLLAPVEGAYGGNCCTALGDPKVVGTLQQDLVCLSGSFDGCPRYVAGAAAVVVGSLEPPRRRRLSASTRAAAVLVGAVAASLAGYALANAAAAGPNTQPSPPPGAVDGGTGQAIGDPLALKPGSDPGSVDGGDRTPPGV